MTRFAQIAKLRLAARAASESRLLEDVLDLIAGRQAVIIEIKKTESARAPLEPAVSKILR